MLILNSDLPLYFLRNLKYFLNKIMLNMNRLSAEISCSIKVCVYKLELD